MVTLKKYQVMADFIYQMSRKYSTFGIDLDFNSHPVITSNDMLKSVREEDYKIMGELKKIYDIFEKNLIAIKKIGKVSQYHEICYTCNTCNRTRTETQNIYLDIDFENMICDDCKNQSTHKTVVKTIEDASNIKCEVDEYGRIIDVEFDSDGKRYRLETDENEYTMGLEEI